MNIDTADLADLQVIAMEHDILDCFDPRIEDLETLREAVRQWIIDGDECGAC
jgi:hypothetical protein